MKKPKEKPTKAVIYCRVSSERQVKEGDGLNSQETRCREFAKQRGFEVVKVFKDSAISGAMLVDDRPAAKDLFMFLDTQKDHYYVIIDDISRMVRGIEAYVDFKVRFERRGATLISPQGEFGSSSSEKLVTNLMVAVASHHRDVNQETVCNRQKARLLNGYWPFGVAPGYKSVPDIGGGKVLVRDEPKATVIAEGLEGFASGRFETQRDMAWFLTSTGAFADRKSGKVNPSTAKSMLTRLLYAGYVEYEPWDVPRRVGKHPPLISLATFMKIQERLGLVAKAPYRKDVTADFPLRGFVLCAGCNEPMTASWSSGRTGKYPYYHCKAKQCEWYGKGVRQERLEGDFGGVLQSLEPSAHTIRVLRTVLEDVWCDKKREHTSLAVDLDRDCKRLDQEIAGFMARLLETSDREIREAYEEHIKTLRRKREMLNAQAIAVREVDTDYASALGTIMDFISSPYNIWVNGDLEDKRLVLKLAFTHRLPYRRNEGFGTAAKSQPFTLIEGLDASKCKVVEGVGFEPT